MTKGRWRTYQLQTSGWVLASVAQWTSVHLGTER